MEGQWKFFEGGGGGGKRQTMRPNCNFQRGGGFKPETFHVGVWRILLEQRTI